MPEKKRERERIVNQWKYRDVSDTIVILFIVQF